MVTPGSGIDVTGNGSPTRPYVIGQRVPNYKLSDILQVVDTDSLDLTMFGSGTPSDRVSISGSAHLKLTELLDVNDPQGSPATNEVPTWVTDHWEFKAPSSIPPGGTLNQVLAKNSSQDGDTKWLTLPSGTAASVYTGSGLGGDGTSGNPVVARTSGTWGLSPLDVYGAQSTSGQQVYVDTSGNLRSGPILFDATVANRLAADLCGKYPMGVSVMALSSAQAISGGWPMSAGGTVLTLRRDTNSAVQLWYRNSNLPLQQQMQMRVGDNTAWGPWALMPQGMIELDGATDLNTILTPGVYSQSSSGEAGSAANYPVSRTAGIPVAGLLEVQCNPAGDLVFQRYTNYKTYLGEVYVRSLYQGAWSAWAAMADGYDTGWINGGTGSSVFVVNPTNTTLAQSWVRRVGNTIHVFLDMSLKVGSNNPTDGSNISNLNLGQMAAAYRMTAPNSQWQSLGVGSGGRLVGIYTNSAGDITIASIAGTTPLASGESITVAGSYVL